MRPRRRWTGWGFVAPFRQRQHRQPGDRRLDGRRPGDRRDRARVFVNRQGVGVLARDHHDTSLALPAGARGRLEILVEDQGRVDYGPRIANELIILELHAASVAVAFRPGPDLGHTEL